MKFIGLALRGVWQIELEPHTDARGFFARTIDEDDFAARGLNGRFVQHSVSFNPRCGTLRGMHYQARPQQEEKLVRVTRGSVVDVLLDLRRDSASYRRWISLTLSAENRAALYIPKGIAHGFQTTAADTEVTYAITMRYDPAAARGVRWNDPAFAIAWPDADRAFLSERDRGYADFTDADHVAG